MMEKQPAPELGCEWLELYHKRADHCPFGGLGKIFEKHARSGPRGLERDDVACAQQQLALASCL